MANQPLSGLSQVFQNGYSTADVMLMLDPTDTTMASTGTDKGVTVATWLAEYLHAGPGIALTPGSTGVTIGTSPAVLYLPGPPYRTHVNHGFFWPQQVSGSQVNLGSAFWWEAWVRAALRQLPDLRRQRRQPCPPLGLRRRPRSGDRQPLERHRDHAVLRLVLRGQRRVDSHRAGLGRHLRHHVLQRNRDFHMLWSGPRTSPGASACGPLFVGGSDHSNLGAKLAFIRGWDQYNPLAGSPWNPFIPERFPFRYALSSAAPLSLATSSATTRPPPGARAWTPPRPATTATPAGARSTTAPWATTWGTTVSSPSGPSRQHPPDADLLPALDVQPAPLVGDRQRIADERVLRVQSSSHRHSNDAAHRPLGGQGL